MGLTINNLMKTFGSEDGKIVAVNDLSIDIEDGEFVVFVGPSGCGKTTTLRCIAGLEVPTSGDILLDDEPIDHLPPQERGIAMVFQNYALYPHLSVRQNIGFGLKNRTNKSVDERNERVEEIAELMGIQDHLDKKPDQLSGGQQQRVATGRAIVRDAQVFLFDEPLSNLDAKLRKHMRTEIQRIQEEFGTTTVYVTHDQEEAMTMADRIVILNDGSLQQIGAPTEIYNEPKNLFVANFVGEPSMNLLEMRLDGTSLVHEAFEYEVSSETIDAIGDATELVLGVRPADIDVAPDGSVSATIEILEELGDENLIHVEIGGESYTVVVEPGFRPDTGEQIRLTFDESDIYLFDRTTEKSLVTRGEQQAKKTVNS